MTKSHPYKLTITWSGVKQGTTSSYTAYSREFTVTAEGKQSLVCSSDKIFRGDPTLYNPEDLLVSALSSCHLLSYLHLCTTKGIHVLSYVDEAVGQLQMDNQGKGWFDQVTLQPKVIISNPELISVAEQLHKEAHDKCFIANSVNFPVNCIPQVIHQ